MAIEVEKDWTLNKPLTGKLDRLADAISALEGWTFGKDIDFRAYGSQLSINGHKFEKIREVSGLFEFADKLNSAVAPVIEAYAKQLRQEMALECVKVANRALEETKEPA